MSQHISRGLCATLMAGFLSGCLSSVPHDLGEFEPLATTVKFDLLAKPLPEVPLPNDLATRYDERSPTGRRINASMLAPTGLERYVRTRIDQLDGWGVNQPITVSFTAPLDVRSILKGHHVEDGSPDLFDLSDDVVYLIDVDPKSPDFGKKVHLDLGQGSYPYTLEDLNPYTLHDPRGWTASLLFEEADEDLNGNGLLDDGEDTDYDGVLDQPNYLPGMSPARDDLAARAAALMTFYERETNTLIMRPMTPLRERTTYAVVITTRLKDLNGDPVGSPFPSKMHLSQLDALQPLERSLAPELTMSEVAFAWSFTTQTIDQGWVAIREGLYGEGIQAHLAEEYPAKLQLAQLRDLEFLSASSRFEAESDSVFIVYTENLNTVLNLILGILPDLNTDSPAFKELTESLRYIDYHVLGSFKSPQLFQRSYAEREAPSCEALCEHLQGCAERRSQPELVADCMERCVGEVEAQGGSDEAQAGAEPVSSGWNDAQRACRYDRCGGFEACEVERPWLPHEAQSWPEDLDQVKVNARSEDVYFWLTVPRKEISARGEGKPAPVVMVGHGYTLNRMDTMLAFAGSLAQTGNAAIAIDCPSHGPVIKPDEILSSYGAIIERTGLKPLVEPLLISRGADQNRDGKIDSGADFWTSYLFHTRDVVRQCTLDHMQLIRILRSFDGVTLDQDRDGDGRAELAGDFDGDGKVDIGGDGVIGITGTSLGGIISSTVAGVEPGLDVSAPIAGGGVLTDIGARSFQAGVMEGVILRLFSSVFTGELRDGVLELGTVLPNLNQMQCFPYRADRSGELETPAGNRKCAASEDAPALATVEGVEPGDTLMALNLENNEKKCGLVNEDGLVQVQLPTDLGDRVELRLYRGVEPCLCQMSCVDPKPAKPYATVTEFQSELTFQGQTFAAGSTLVALAEGLGLERATPSFRRFLGIGQLVLDPADPASLAKHYKKEPLVFPRVGDQTDTNTVVITTMGDMNVPASSGLSVARAAGFVDFLNPVIRDGKDQYEGTQYEGFSANQILISVGAAEAVHLTRPELSGQGSPIHIDVENLSQGQDRFDHDSIEDERRLGVTRLDPPLRAWAPDQGGGVSGAMFMYVNPTGKHGFELPGDERKWFTDECRASCEGGQKLDGVNSCRAEQACGDFAEGSDEREQCEQGCLDLCYERCAEDASTVFDGGYFMVSVLGKYFASGGSWFEMNFCEATRTCTGDEARPPVPEIRE